jgi:hypothetical protein
MTTPKDLTKEAPRSPRVRMGGYALMARMIDKGRATLNGTNGEYHFACPLDQMLFSFKGVATDDVKTVLASGAADDEVATWFDEHGTPKSADEIKLGLIRSKRYALATIRKRRNGSPANALRLGLIPRRPRWLSILRPTIA